MSKLLPRGRNVQLSPCGPSVQMLPCGCNVQLSPRGHSVQLLPCGQIVQPLPRGPSVQKLNCYNLDLPCFSKIPIEGKNWKHKTNYLFMNGILYI